MEPILILIEVWWWAVPAAAGAGAVGYSALTTNRRRARRLALDAARHEAQLAHRALLTARARVRSAQADVLSARAQRGPAAMRPAIEAKSALQTARQEERSAALAWRAARTRVKASESAYRARAASEQLPLEELMAAHDRVLARWLVYETDAEVAMAHPQMADARHPETRTFLEAQRHAQGLRPATARTRMTPAEFVAYRDAVRTLESTLMAAEIAAGAAEPPPRAPISPWTGIWPALLWRPSPPDESH